VLVVCLVAGSYFPFVTKMTENDSASGAGAVENRDSDMWSKGTVGSSDTGSGVRERLRGRQLVGG